MGGTAATGATVTAPGGGRRYVLTMHTEQTTGATRRQKTHLGSCGMYRGIFDAMAVRPYRRAAPRGIHVLAEQSPLYSASLACS